MSHRTNRVLRPVLLLHLFFFLFLLGSPGGERDAWAAPGDIVTVAGGGAGDGAAATSAPMDPKAVAFDGSGNLLVADCFTNTVRKIDSSGITTTIAGVGSPGFFGDGGPAVQAALYCPSGVAVDGAGNVFIGDQFNHRIRKVDTAGVITTIAGNGTSSFSGDGGPATSASLSRPMGVAVDAAGSVYVADYYNNRVRKISSSGTITTYAGSAVYSGGDGGSATSAGLTNPIGVAVDGYGNLYIADSNNHRIRKVDTAGIISTIAGGGAVGYLGDNGPATSAFIGNPGGVFADPSGNVFIADNTGHRIRKVDASGIITTVAGTGTGGFSGDGGAASSATLYYPVAVITDGDGNVLIADDANRRVRKVDSYGIISTVAGNGTGFFGEGVPATAAALWYPTGVSMDGSGNICIADQYNHRVRRVDTNGVISTLAGTGTAGSSGDGGPAALAKLNGPYDVAADSGKVLIADGYTVRGVAAATGLISVVAGGGSTLGDYGPATAASVGTVYKVAMDGAGNFYLSDRQHQRIRKVDAAGVITTIAGTGVAGYSGDGGYAWNAAINNPLGIAADAAGNVYFCDTDNFSVRKISPSGIISPIAGGGTAGFSGDGGLAILAKINRPDSIVVDATGNVYFSDSNNHRVRKIDTKGIITTVAGNGVMGFAGDNGVATSASLNYPQGLYMDPAGNLLIADRGNARIRKILAGITPTGTVIINSGAPATNSAAVTLTLSCPSATCTEMQFSNDARVWSAPEPFATSKAWTLPSGDGQKWAYAQFRDDTGAWSSLQGGTIILDTTPPVIYISYPGTYSNTASAHLSYNISDGTAVVKVDGAVVNTPNNGYLDPLPEGAHTLRVEATDAAGNASFLEKTFTIDTVAPVISVTSPSAGTTYSTGPTLLYTVSDGTVTVKVDGSVVSKVSGSTLSGLAEGAHTVRVESGDVAGNVGYMEVPFTLTLPPTVTITAPAQGSTTNNTTPVLTYSISNGTVVVKVDGVVANKVSGDTLGPFADGSHTVRVEATNAVGTGFAETTFTIDTAAPVISLTSPTAATTDSQPLLTYTVSDGTVTVKVDGVTVSKVSGDHLATLLAGQHTVRVESRDAAGNVGFSQVTFSTTAPSFTSEGFESGTMNNIPWVLTGNGLWAAKTTTRHSGVYSAEAPVSITDSQSAGMEVTKLCNAGNVSFWYSVSSEANYDFLTFYIDGVQQNRWSGTVSWSQASFAVAAGNHTFKWVYSKDSSVSANSDTAWVDDIAFPTTPTVPTVTISSPAAGATNNNRPLLSYSVSDGTVVVKVDGAVVSKVSGNPLDPVADGSHTVRVEATNAVGTGSAETTFTVDTVSPALGTDPVVSPTTANSQTITGTRETGATVNVSVNTAATLDAVTYPDSTTWSCAVSNLAEGANTFTVSATDAANNTVSATATITLDTTPPQVNISSPQAGLINSRTPLLSYATTEGAPVVTLDGVVVTKASGDTIGPLADGAHTVRLSAVDAAGNSGFAEVSFVVDATAPTVTITAPTAGTTNNPTPPLAFTVSEGTAVVSVDGVVVPLYSGDNLDRLSDGPHTVRVTTSDAAGNSAYAEVSFTVDTGVPWVRLSSPANGITNNNRPVLDYTTSEGTVVVKVDGNVVSKVSGDALDQLADGLHVVRIEATDTAGNLGFAETTFTVDTAAPVVSISAPVAGPSNDMPQLIFSATDGAVVVKVDDVVVSKVSGDRLDQLAPGVHTVRVEATDIAGNLGFAEVSFTVESFTVTLQAGSNGSIAGPTTASYGSLPTYTFTPNTGYHIVDVTVNGVSVGAVSSYTFTSGITANAVITADFAVDTFAIAATADANGSVTGPATVNYGGSATYTITPAANYHVSDVLVDGASVGAVTSYSFSNVTAAHTISASFAINSYAMTVTAGSNGSISGPVSVTYDSSATYTVTPATGYHIADVLVDGVSVGAVTSYSFSNVTATHTISASFAINSYAMTATAGSNGSISGPASVNYGGSAAYTITPVTGYHVADVLVDGVSVGAVTSYSFSNVTATHTISASFDINSYSITATAGSNGTISGPASVTYNGSATYTITPATGYHIADVLVDGVSIGGQTSYSFTNVRTTHTISASFAINSFAITTNTSAGGSISGPATVNYGGSATYTMTPATGYHLTDVTIDGVSVGAVTSYTISNVTASHTIVATFNVTTYNVTPAPGPNGDIYGLWVVGYGGSPTYTIAPATGYHVADVTVDGVSVGAVTSYTLVNVTANHTIAASFGINSYAITASAGANGSISGPASVNYNGNAAYTITAATGYHVADVLVDGVSVGAVTSYSFTWVTATHTISASFAINSYAITATSGSNGSISGPASANYGGSAAYTISPATGYHVADVLVDGVSVGAVTSYSFSNVTATHSISASFAIDSYGITATAGSNGSISGPASVNYGGTATYTITPAAGYHIADVVVDGVSVGAVSSYGFSNVTATHTISASFAINSYGITATAGSNGSISGPVSVTYGGSATYSITPAVGYHIADVVVDGVSVGAVSSYSFSNVAATHTISASFAINTYGITATAGSNGSISGPASVNYGGSATYIITPATGYHIGDVVIDGVSVGAVGSYSFSNVTASHTISASFAINSYGITATAGSNGTISGPASVTYGGSAVYTITPAANYGVSDVLVDGVSVGAVTSYTFTGVAANHTISAMFDKLPDLVVKSVTGPTNMTRGSSASVSASISNQGGPAGSFTVAFYLSKDTAVNSSDTLLGTVTVPSLGAGSTTTVSGSFTVPTALATGKNYVGAIVDSDSVITETNETNNTKSGTSTNVK